MYSQKKCEKAAQIYYQTKFANKYSNNKQSRKNPPEPKNNKNYMGQI